VDASIWYALAADAALLLHTLFVVFVVLGLVLVMVGWGMGWRWVRNPWFRLAHVLAIAVVTLQAWLGRACPLTALEMSLRARAGDAVYPGSFVAHWLELLLYYQASPWVFTLLYSLFGVLVVASWCLVRPGKLRDFRRDL